MIVNSNKIYYQETNIENIGGFTFEFSGVNPVGPMYEF
jgi:hypothetical protein